MSSDISYKCPICGKKLEGPSYMYSGGHRGAPEHYTCNPCDEYWETPELESRRKSGEIKEVTNKMELAQGVADSYAKLYCQAHRTLAQVTKALEDAESRLSFTGYGRQSLVCIEDNDGLHDKIGKALERGQKLVSGGIKRVNTSN